MSRYDHEKRTDRRCAQFVRMCAERVPEWEDGAAALVAFKAPFRKQIHFVAHCHGKSYAWVVCTRRRWAEARKGMGLPVGPPMREVNLDRIMQRHQYKPSHKPKGEPKTPWNPSRRATARVKDPVPAPVECNYCASPVKITHHDEIYGRAYGEWPWVYACTSDDCDARVGIHPFTSIPLGSMADGFLRSERIRCKSVFERFWHGSGLDRNEAYAALAAELGIDRAACHFGSFNVEQCRQAAEASNNLLSRQSSIEEQTP